LLDGDSLMMAPAGEVLSTIAELTRKRKRLSDPDLFGFISPGDAARLDEWIAAEVKMRREAGTPENQAALMTIGQNTSFGTSSRLMPCLLTHGEIYSYLLQRCILPKERFVVQGYDVYGINGEKFKA
jgi:hypothetical protein